MTTQNSQTTQIPTIEVEVETPPWYRDRTVQQVLATITLLSAGTIVITCGAVLAFGLGIGLLILGAVLTGLGILVGVSE